MDGDREYTLLRELSSWWYAGSYTGDETVPVVNIIIATIKIHRIQFLMQTIIHIITMASPSENIVCENCAQAAGLKTANEALLATCSAQSAKILDLESQLAYLKEENELISLQYETQLKVFKTSLFAVDDDITARFHAMDDKVSQLEISAAAAANQLKVVVNPRVDSVHTNLGILSSEKIGPSVQHIPTESVKVIAVEDDVIKSNLDDIEYIFNGKEYPSIQDAKVVKDKVPTIKAVKNERPVPAEKLVKFEKYHKPSTSQINGGFRKTQSDTEASRKTQPKKTKKSLSKPKPKKSEESSSSDEEVIPKQNKRAATDVSDTETKSPIVDIAVLAKNPDSRVRTIVQIALDKKPFKPTTDWLLGIYNLDGTSQFTEEEIQEMMNERDPLADDFAGVSPNPIFKNEPKTKVMNGNDWKFVDHNRSFIFDIRSVSSAHDSGMPAEEWRKLCEKYPGPDNKLKDTNLKSFKIGWSRTHKLRTAARDAWLKLNAKPKHDDTLVRTTGARVVLVAQSDRTVVLKTTIPRGSIQFGGLGYRVGENTSVYIPSFNWALGADSPYKNKPLVESVLDNIKRVKTERAAREQAIADKLAEEKRARNNARNAAKRASKRENLAAFEEKSPEVVIVPETTPEATEKVAPVATPETAQTDRLSALEAQMAAMMVMLQRVVDKN